MVVLALVAGFFLRSRWSSLFPNTAEEPVRSAREGSEQTPITRATELAREGNRAMAIAQLKRVPPPSPFYDEAQALITQWEAEEAAAAGEGAPLAPDQAARQEELLALARQAHAEGRHLAVEPLLQQAATIAALPPDVQAIREESAANLQPLQDALTLLRSEEYERSLRMLWEAHEADPTNPDVRHLLVSAYHNMGVLSLQQGKPEEAGEHFQEALELAPGDAELQRLQQLARTYRDRAPDLLYRIYTKYLTPRKL